MVGIAVIVAVTITTGPKVKDKGNACQGKSSLRRRWRTVLKIL